MQQIKQFSTINEEITCTQNNKAYNVCVESSCKNNSFLCDDRQCDCQIKIHKQCLRLRLDYFFDTIKQRKQQMPLQVKKSYQAIKLIYKSAIEQLSKDLIEVQTKMEGYGLKQYECKFYNFLNNRDPIEFNGQFMSKLKQQIKSTKLNLYVKPQSQINKYWNQKQKYFILFRQSIKSLTSMSFQSNFQSLITKDQLLIRQFLGDSVKKFKLLYRASENNFQITKFHSLCDFKQNTLILAQTQFGKIIGGFTPILWNAAANNNYVSDPSMKSFLFSITNRQKYPLITYNGTNAILCNSTYGPIFGGGADFYISNNGNYKDNGSSFPTSYNNGKYTKNQQSFKSFSGATLNSYFKLKQWQVFQVQF